MARGKYAGRYEKGGKYVRRQRKSKFRVSMLSIFLILSLSVGGTLAYLIAQTDAIQNQFVPASVTCRVNANDDNTFDVTNTGNVNAYIRAAIVVNWVDANGNVRGIAPTTSEYTLTVNTTDVNNTDWWQDTSTGYYYYKDSVSPGGTTNDLVTSYGLAQDVTAPAGYELCVEVVAEAIQAEGDTDANGTPAYQDAWGISPISGN